MQTRCGRSWGLSRHGVGCGADSEWCSGRVAGLCRRRRSGDDDAAAANGTRLCAATMGTDRSQRVVVVTKTHQEQADERHRARLVNLAGWMGQ